jgi:glycosyltransferase involved in cell wall biosynthesis
MRIGHYAPHIWAPGGIATYVRRLGDAQADRGHTVFYLSRTAADAEASPPARIVDSDAALFQKADELELDILHLHKSVSTLPARRVPTIRTMHGHQGSCPSASRYLARSGTPCDRIPNLGGCLVGHLWDRCGSARPSQIADNFSRLRHEIDFASQVHTLPVSDYLRDRMIEAGCAPDQLTTVHSAAPSIPAPTPLPKTTAPRFLFLGRLAPEKGILWLLRAFARACEDPSFNGFLDIAGTGDLEEDARQYVNTQELGHRITFHGWVSPDELPTLMQRAWAVVFPSLWHEPAGLVSLEAAAHGRALIASRVGGIPEYTTDESALLVPPNNIPELARAITTLAADPSQASRLGRGGRRLATEQFGMPAFLDRLDTLYASIAGLSSVSVTA